MRTFTLLIATLFLFSLGGCFIPVRHHRHRHAQPPPPPPAEPAPEGTQPPAEGTQPQTVDPGSRRAPPAPDAPPPAPAFSFSLGSTQAAPGTEVRLHLSIARPAEVFFNGRVLPKKVLDGGRTLVVTVPAGSTSGFFELEVDGRRVRAPQQLIVTP